jgi:hypothetical protein
MYDLLIDTIPPKRTYIKYISTKKEKNKYTDYVCDYYQCSPKEANEYIELKGEEWAKSIVKQFGGNI